MKQLIINFQMVKQLVSMQTPAEIIQQVIEQNEIQLEQLKIEYEKNKTI